MGKSQMLNSCASIAPRGVFVTGNTTTSSGLTVTVSKDAGNDFSLEAGALVLADQGEEDAGCSVVNACFQNSFLQESVASMNLIK